MLNAYKYEGKTKEEAMSKCLNDLNVEESSLYIKEKETDGSLFKSKKVELEVFKKEDIVTFIKDYIKELGNLMKMDINLEIREVENSFNLELVSDDNSILIGKDGRTITAIQILLRQTGEKQVHQIVKINVDVANYNDKKLKHMQYEIKKIALEVQKSKVDVALDPMNSYERRIIHNMLDEYENITTDSVGVGSDRHIVIKYVEK